MQKTKPNYHDLGLSSSMSTRLRSLVEKQLLLDLKNYSKGFENLKFDWSESCIEGHESNHLGGYLENFSGIAIYNTDEKLIADGWMDFIHEGDFFLAFWDYITIWHDQERIFEKAKPGIPNHIWNQIPEEIRWIYIKNRLIT